MTNKAKYGLMLVAMHQLDIVWDKQPAQCTVTYWGSGHPEIISRSTIKHTITRHTDALMEALEGIMDSHLGRNFKIPPEITP